MVNLTNRELEVLELLAEGITNRKIGEKLYISVHTVKAILEGVYDKLGLHNRVQVSLYYVFNYRPEKLKQYKII